MRSIWLENRRLELRTVPVPEPQLGEALVRVRLAGICATDLELVKGYYPFTGILGHEFVGEVAAAPQAPEWTGARVVGEINAVCHTCPTCLRGDPTHCENRTVLGISGRDGAFAEFLCLPLANLRRVPEGISDEKAVFTEPLAAALEILDQVSFRPEARVLVVGAGRLGQLIAQVLDGAGLGPQVAARHKLQRAMLAARGIRWIAPEDIPAAAFDVVVEATGSGTGFADARRAVRPRGTIVLKSTYAGNLEVNFSSIVVDEVTLIGSRCGPFGTALEWLQSGRVDPLPLIQARYALSDGLEAFDHAARPGVMKVLIEIQGIRGKPRAAAGAR